MLIGWGGGGDLDELLPYITMGYRMSKRKALESYPYFLMFGHDLIFQSKMQHSKVGSWTLNVIKGRLQISLNERGQAFMRVMPLAMRNLAIAQQQDKERYQLVQGENWDRPMALFMPRDHVMLKQQTENTLYALARLRELEENISWEVYAQLGSHVQVRYDARWHDMTLTAAV